MIAHSYLRFSTKSQEDSDSERRQFEKTVELCNKKGWKLELRFADRGKSSFNGDKQKALKALLTAIEKGEIRKGEVLVVEAIDRLSRKGIRATQNLVNRILDSGVHIAIWSPLEKIYRADQESIGDAIELSAFAYQAHIYSKNLSLRLLSFNEGNRKRVAKGEGRLSAFCPSWLHWNKEKERYEKIPESVKAVKHIFKRTIEGVGRKTMLRELNEKFRPISKRKNSHSWNETLVSKIVKGRQVLGEAKSTVTGQVFKEHYPAIIDEKTWRLANASAARRKTKRGPSSHKVNLMNGILYHAVDDCTMQFFCSHSIQKKAGKVHRRRYKSYLKEQNVQGASSETVDVDKFDRWLLKLLPAFEISTDSVDPTIDLIRQKEYLELEIETLQNAISSGSQSATVLIAPLTNLQEQLQEIESELQTIPRSFKEPTRAERKIISDMPLDTNEERESLHEALRDVIKRIDILPVKLGEKRSSRVRCVIEIQFHNGNRCSALQLDNWRHVAISRIIGPTLKERCQKGWRVKPADFKKLDTTFDGTDQNYDFLMIEHGEDSKEVQRKGSYAADTTQSRNRETIAKQWRIIRRILKF